MKTGSIALVVLVAVTAAAAAVQIWRASGPVAGAAAAVVGGTFVVFFYTWMLRTGRHVSLREAERQAADGTAIALWKPGCQYCAALQREMADDDRVTWVNVYADREANARVRELNEGNEYTPTVIIGRRVLRNPSADEVRAVLEGDRFRD